VNHQPRQEGIRRNVPNSLDDRIRQHFYATTNKQAEYAKTVTTTHDTYTCSSCTKGTTRQSARDHKHGTQQFQTDEHHQHWIHVLGINPIQILKTPTTNKSYHLPIHIQSKKDKNEIEMEQNENITKARNYILHQHSASSNYITYNSRLQAAHQVHKRQQVSLQR